MLDEPAIILLTVAAMAMIPSPGQAGQTAATGTSTPAATADHKDSVMPTRIPDTQPQRPMSRVPLPPVATMTPEQRASYDQSVKFFGAPTGPRLVMIETPEVAQAWNKLAEALNTSALPKTLWELSILTVAREWTSQFEWWAHEPFAVKAGIAPDVITAIKVGHPPHFTREDEAATYAYVTELMRDHAVSDATYNRLRAIIGSRQLVELTVLMGHYNNVAMALAAHAVQLPPGVTPPLPVLKRR